MHLASSSIFHRVTAVRMDRRLASTDYQVFPVVLEVKAQPALLAMMDRVVPMAYLAGLDYPATQVPCTKKGLHHDFGRVKFTGRQGLPGRPGLGGPKGDQGEVISAAPGPKGFVGEAGNPGL